MRTLRRVDVARDISRTAASAASWATSGSTLVYVSAVIAMVEWPSISDTTWRFAPPQNVLCRDSGGSGAEAEEDEQSPLELDQRRCL